MTYVATRSKTDAELAAERAADERWMKDHAPVHNTDAIATTPGAYYRPAVEFSAVGSAH